MLLAVAWPWAAEAQQFVTDDAAITRAHSCQLEVWHGEENSWIQPACSPVPRLEILAAFGFLKNSSGSRDRDAQLRLKTLFRTLEESRVAWGLAGGITWEVSERTARRRPGNVFVYAPFTLSAQEQRFLVHVNMGWLFRPRPDAGPNLETQHAALWGVRGDAQLTGRLALIGEVYGTSRQARPEFQAGLRTTVWPQRMLVDVSWGGHTDLGTRGAGWTVGVSLTPPPFLPGRWRRAAARSVPVREAGS